MKRRSIKEDRSLLKAEKSLSFHKIFFLFI